MSWTLNAYGFFSTVLARKRVGGRDALDIDMLVVRARRREHLEALLRAFGENLGHPVIVSTPHSDYPVRVVVTKKAWTEVSAFMSNAIDYDNFKGSIDTNLAHRTSGYATALHEIWSVLRRIEEHPRR